jgi:D-alanyl-D-alanine dipeptidase
MMLSKNLSVKEVVKSSTAIKHGIANEPSVTHLHSLKALAENVFQPMREHFGVPIAITSGYRSPALNDLIGGSSSSQHSKGEAIDVDADVFGGTTNADIFNYLREHTDFDQLIWEFGTNENPAWVHVSYKKENNRGEVLMAYKNKGLTRYKHI